MIKYYKYQAIGNDYIVINPQECSIDLSVDCIKLICDRHFGIGSDGILFGPLIEDDIMSFKIFNPDGSEAEKSGNGIRIFAQYLIDYQYSDARNFKLKTLGGMVEVEKLDNDAIRVSMGKASFKSEEIPVDGEPREVINEKININGVPYKITCVSIGNPHCVIPVSKVKLDLIDVLGPIVENLSMFPNRINVQMLEIIDRKNIKIEIWERGAGYTLASGSSSCAAACAAYKLGLIDNEVIVHMPGGSLSIVINDDWEVQLTGTVSSVSEGIMTKQFYEELLKIEG